MLYLLWNPRAVGNDVEMALNMIGAYESGTDAADDRDLIVRAGAGAGVRLDEVQLTRTRPRPRVRNRAEAPSDGG